MKFCARLAFYRLRLSQVFLSQHTSHLFLHSPTDGAARIIIVYTISPTTLCHDRELNARQSGTSLRDLFKDAQLTELHGRGDLALSIEYSLGIRDIMGFSPALLIKIQYNSSLHLWEI